jgi:histone-lysine N-methyltransferase SETMAR
MLDKPKKLKAELQDWKCLMVVALWKDQVLTYQILHEGETMDSVKYLDFLENKVLPIVIAKKFGRPYILHDNARPHKHRIIMEFFQDKRWEELDHPPYSPDMSPPDMDGIHRIKAPLKGKQFQTRDELVHDCEAVIRDINEKHESKGITMLPDRWRSITLSRGKYIV